MFLDKGREVSTEDDSLAEREKRIAELQPLLGHKEVQISCSENFMRQRR